jgi:predicted nuclease of predicted toxin-antitoxin system
LSPKLVRRLADLFPDSLHVRTVGLREAEDRVIWRYAAEHGLVIVSKDADFYQRALQVGAPPEVISLKLGNCTVDAVEQLLRRHVEDIMAFGRDDEPVLVLL